jgi:hypothetical protein
MMSSFYSFFEIKWLGFGNKSMQQIQNLLLLVGFSLFIAFGLSVKPIYALVIFPALISWLVSRRKPSLIFYFWFLYFSYVLLSSIWSGISAWDSLDKLKHLLYIILFIYALDRYSHYGCGVFIFGASIAIALFVEVYSILNYISLNGFSTWFERFPRIYGVIGIENPIYISSIIAISTVAVVSLVDRINKNLLLIFLAFAICALVITPLQTRASLLGLCAGFFVLLFQMQKYKVLAGFMLAGVVAGIFMVTGIDRFSSNNYPRLDIWLYAYERVIGNCNFMFGCGFLYDFEINLHGRSYSQFHSLIFSQFFYGGVIGFSMFLGVLSFTLYKMYVLDSKLLPALCASLVMLLTMRHEIINNPDITWILLWLPIGLSGLFFSIPCKGKKQLS